MTDDTEALDNASKALALARLGIKVFPVFLSNRAPAISEKEGGRGFYDAVSDDFELIATWFTGEYAESQKYGVGVWTGGSGLFVADIDQGKKNGKDGFESIRKAGLESDLGKTHSYPTQSGGQHRIFQTDRVDLTPGSDVKHEGVALEGVDIRAGGSYIVWWGNDVPASRAAFSKEIPEWLVAASAAEANFTGEGFSGSVSDWLEAIPDDTLPSGRINDLMARIPTGEFGHPQMVELAWEAVRLGSERETGVRRALDALKDAWLRPPYDKPKFKRDLDMALRGAINKAGRVQHPVPSMSELGASMTRAAELGIADALKSIEREVSETDTEIEFARARRAMFKIAADGGLAPSGALGIVTGSKSFRLSKAGLESAWFGDGEPAYHEKIAKATSGLVEAEEKPLTREEEITAMVTSLASDSGAFSYLDEAETALLALPSHKWWGDEYLEYIEKRLKHFNRAYHVGAMWAALSAIVSPWGKVPLTGARATDCNLYISVLGESSTGKSEAWGFGTSLIDAYYGTEGGPILGDVQKLSALALHRALVLRDGKASLVYGDEIQSFFEGIGNSQWQNGILGDLSSHYGGDVSPKLTLNDKEISGKRAKTMLTTYLTGIADQTLDAVSLSNWTNGFFYRFLWGFGNPRKMGDYSISMEVAASSYTGQMETWAKEFQRVAAYQATLWGEGRLVLWEEDAKKRMEAFKEQIDVETMKSPLYEAVFVNANGRFLTSIMKVATIIALVESSEKVSLRHVLIAISYAGPWHRSMVLAVDETGKEPFEREVDRALTWIRRNAIKQIGKPPYIQRSAVMRAFKPNEIAERLLRQLTEEGWLIRSGDMYQIAEEDDK